MNPTVESHQASEAVAWHAKGSSAVADSIRTDVVHGLTAQDAQRRLAIHGPNALAQTGGETWLRALGRQFQDVLIWVLLAAAAISLAIGHATDAITILVIVRM